MKNYIVYFFDRDLNRQRTYVQAHSRVDAIRKAKAYGLDVDCATEAHFDTASRIPFTESGGLA